MGEETEYLTPDQVAAALEAADDQTQLRLHRYLVSLGYAGMDSDDIRNEVWVQIYEGRRKCPVYVDPVAFFRQSAHSIVTQQYDRQTRSQEGLSGMQADPTTAQPSAMSDPEAMLIDMERQEQIDQWIYQNFSADRDALRYLEMRLLGQTPTEIKDATGWNDTQFETIRRRVARHLKQKAGDRKWKESTGRGRES